MACAAGLAGAVLCSCASPAGDRPASLWKPASKVKRSEATAIADAYVLHRWRPTKANIFHGTDPQGIRVDTPDACHSNGGEFPGWWKPDEENEGLPYKWGGFDTPAQFDAAIRRGRWAGDVYSLTKRALNNAAVSSLATGVDCSGFISRCWRLAAPFSTYEIATLCDPLPDFTDLRPGDVVNKEHEHISLFGGFSEDHPGHLIVYDVGCPPHWKTVRHLTPVAWLRENGYRPWRYRGIMD